MQSCVPLRRSAMHARSARVKCTPRREEMVRTIRKAVRSLMLVTVLAAGCSKPGSEFVGKWVNSSNTTDTMDIERNGDQFTITGADQEKIPATYNNGSLQVAGVMGSMMTLTYVKSSDSVVAPGLIGQVQYKRAK